MILLWFLHNLLYIRSFFNMYRLSDYNILYLVIYNILLIQKIALFLFIISLILRKLIVP